MMAETLEVTVIFMSGSDRKLSGTRGRAIAATMAATLALGAPPASALTELPNRPSDPAPLERIDTLRALAAQVGWGSLKETEHMKLADTAYGAPPVIAVTAAPYLPVTFFLESRRWAAQRFLGVAEADEHFAEIWVDPADGLRFDLLVLTEDVAVLEASATTVRFADDTGRSLPAMPVALEVTEEPALGGALFAGRATILVPLPDDFDWDAVSRFSLAFEAGTVDRVLEWTFPD